MSGQKSMALSYLRSITSVAQCLHYERNKGNGSDEGDEHKKEGDDSKIFNINGVLFCSYRGKCPHHSEERTYFYEYGDGALRCKLGSSKTIEDLSDDTGILRINLVNERESRESESVEAATLT